MVLNLARLLAKECAHAHVTTKQLDCCLVFQAETVGVLLPSSRTALFDLKHAEVLENLVCSWRCDEKVLQRNRIRCADEDRRENRRRDNDEQNG